MNYYNKNEHFFNVSLFFSIHRDSVPFATSEQTNRIRVNRELGRSILQACLQRLEGFETEPDYRHIKNSKRLFMLVSKIGKTLYQRCVQRLIDLCGNFDSQTAMLCAECFKVCLMIVGGIYERMFGDFLKIIIPDASESKTRNLRTIIEVLHSLLVDFVKEDSEIDSNVETKKIPGFLLKSLEILYEKTTDSCLSQEIYEFLINFCTTTTIDGHGLNLIHKLLFEQRIRTQTGVFFSSIAYQIQTVFDKIEESTLNDSEQQEQHDGSNTLKTITAITAESCTIYLCQSLKEQITHIEYFIVKVKSLSYRLRIPGQGDDTNDTLSTMKSIERKICSQLFHISNTLVILTNTKLPLGPCMDSLLRLLLELFICLANLTKHLILRHSITPVLFPGLKFDQLIKVAGKPLAENVYGLITYIEENIIIPDGKKGKKNDPQLSKAKVLKETKFLPRLILNLENFNKFVILLSKKTKNDLTGLLHIGTVRDFRIKTSELREAIQKSIQKGSNVEIGDDGDSTNIDDDSERVETESNISTQISTNTTGVGSDVDKEEGNDDDDDNDDDETDVEKKKENLKAKFLQNLKTINKRSTRKRKDEGRGPGPLLEVAPNKRVRTARKKT